MTIHPRLLSQRAPLARWEETGRARLHVSLPFFFGLLERALMLPPSMRVVGAVIGAPDRDDITLTISEADPRPTIPAGYREEEIELLPVYESLPHPVSVPNDQAVALVRIEARITPRPQEDSSHG